MQSIALFVFSVAAIFPTITPYYPMRVVYCVNPNVKLQQSRKRPSVDTSPANTKRLSTSESHPGSLRVFMSYLRQQYAFCPRWWFLFRLVVNNIMTKTAENKERFILACLLLLVGKRKERKLLASYLHISFDKTKSVQLDRCFTRTNLATSLPILLYACEEVLCFGCLINPWTFQSPFSDDTRIYSRRKEETISDSALSNKIAQFQSQNYQRFEVFMRVFEQDPERRERVIRILQDVRK